MIEKREAKTINVEQEETLTQNVESKSAEEKLEKLKSAFPKLILDKNPKIAEMLQEADSLDTIKQTDAKNKKIKEICKYLKEDPKILKSITDQL